VVVVSALAKVTDSLVAIAELAEDGASDKAARSEGAARRHLSVAAAVTSASRAKVLEDVKREFDELNASCTRCRCARGVAAFARRGSRGG